MEKKVFTGQSNIFYNSKCLFVEYEDIIKMPQFMLLCGLEKASIPGLSEVMDISEILDYTEDELLEWYVTRRYKNIYMNFPFLEMEGEAKKIFCDKLLESHLATNEIFYDVATELNFSTVLQEILSHHSLINRAIIYSSYENEYIKEDVKDNYPGCTMRFGDIERALEDIPADSTFVFSDVEHINVLEKTGKLQLSSIILPHLYRYNYDPETGDEKVNLTELMSKYVFKLNYFAPLS